MLSIRARQIRRASQRLGGVAAKVGGASVAVGAGRVTFWGILAMVATAVVGSLFGTVAG